MINSPEQFLGFKPGTGRNLAGWDELVSYYEHLAEGSPRLELENLGETTEGRPFLLAVITSEDNHAHLDEFRRIQHQLADPRGLDAVAADDLLNRGRTVVMISCSIHATEVGAAQMAPELAHELITGQDDYTKELLHEVILLLVPSLNPDGLELVRTWYEETLDTPYEGARPVELYHKYTGHDNNRDWFMFTQAETQLTVEHIHNRWHPQIVFDMHQMGSDGYRFVLPPFIDPIDPNVDHMLQSQIASLGTYMASRLTSEGKEGVATNVIYDAYSPSRAYQHYHGGVRILSEAASAQLASSINLDSSELKSRGQWDPQKTAWNHPLPWSGGKWTLRDIVEYQKTAAYGCLEHAAAFRKVWLNSFLSIGQRAVEWSGPPYAYVLPAAQRDRGALRELIEVMLTAAVEVERAVEPFTADGVEYPAGTYVIRLAQPYGSFVKTMMEVQEYPDLREYEGGPPKRPYDITGHTLWLQLGVAAVEVEHAFDAELELVEEAPETAGMVQVCSADKPSEHKAYLIEPYSNDAAFLAFHLLQNDHRVHRLKSPATLNGKDYEQGTFAVLTRTRTAEVEELVEGTGVKAERLELADVRKANPDLWQLGSPRIGLYKSWKPNTDEGWTRFIFDQHDIPYRSLRNADIKRGDLAEDLDAIILPSQEAKVISEGLSEDEYPPQYCGGIGAVGAACLQEFVRQGGTLIALDKACNWALEKLWLPVKNVAASMRPEDFYVPGSLLKTVVDTSHPVAYGMPRETTVLFVRSPAFVTQGGSTIARYPLQNPLVSGFILGADHLSGRGALVEVPVGKGKVVLIGFRTQFRAQTRGTYKFLLNPLLHSAASTGTL